MVRPQSIVRYEQLYLASFVLGLVASWLTWSSRVAMMAANPLLAGQTWPLWTVLILGIVITLTLWYFTARRPSAVAKWIVVIFAAFAVIGILMAIAQLATGRVDFGLPVIVGLLVDILYIAAATLLFRPDARPWFGSAEPIPEPLA